MGDFEPNVDVCPFLIEEYCVKTHLINHILNRSTLEVCEAVVAEDFA